MAAVADGISQIEAGSVRPTISGVRGVEEIVRYCACKGTVEIPERMAFRLAMVEAAFLFGPEIEKYLGEVSDHAQTLEVSRFEMWQAQQGVPHDRVKLSEESRREFEWLELQSEESKKKFKKYLDLSKL